MFRDGVEDTLSLPAFTSFDNEQRMTASFDAVVLSRLYPSAK
jgi:hypothetical protein